MTAADTSEPLQKNGAAHKPARRPAITLPGDACEGPPDMPEAAFKFVSSADLAGGDYRPSWLVPRVLVKGQPGVIAGPSKSMKTSLLIDLAVSLASGRPFLGHFDVPTPHNVAVVSGESGAHTIQETALRVCRARGVSLPNLDRLSWRFDLPTLADLASVDQFTTALAAIKADVVIVDPLYLALGGDIDHSNLFQMGRALRISAELFQRAGITPVYVHHANRKLPTGEVMELSHLAYSGLEQFCRQFLLLNRQRTYESDGVHELWLRIGGSAGHGGLWGVRIEEGLTDADFEGRQWDVTVQAPQEVRAERQDRREIAKDEAARSKVRVDGTKVMDAIDREKDMGRAPTSITRLRDATSLGPVRIRKAVDALVREGRLEIYTGLVSGGRGAKQEAECVRRPVA